VPPEIVSHITSCILIFVMGTGVVVGSQNVAWTYRCFFIESDIQLFFFQSYPKVNACFLYLCLLIRLKFFKASVRFVAIYDTLVVAGWCRKICTAIWASSLCPSNGAIIDRCDRERNCLYGLSPGVTWKNCTIFLPLSNKSISGFLRVTGFPKWIFPAS